GPNRYSVSDAHHSTTTGSVTITEPAVSLTATTTQSLHGALPISTGAATITAAGGTPGYTYLWTGGAATATITGLTAGTYSYTVKDGHPCSTTGSITITEPAASPSANKTQTDVSCHGNTTGAATIM